MAFIPLYGALARSNLEYGLPACSLNLVADINRLEQIQRLATRLVIGMRHLPYEERLQRLGPHSLRRRRLWTDLIAAFKIFTGLLDIDLNFFFLPPARCGLSGHPYKVVQCARMAFSVRVVKYWNNAMFSRNDWKYFGQKFFLTPARHGLRGHPYKVLQGANRRRRGGSVFSVRVVKYWNKLPASVLKIPSANILRKSWRKFG